MSGSGLSRPHRPGVAAATLRNRHPWSSDEINILADGARDGLPTKALAHTLKRSPNAVTGMLRKMGIGTLRHGTKEIVLAIKVEAIEKLAAFARERSMTINTFASYVLEILAGDKAEFLKALTDEDAVSARHDALPLEDPRPAVTSPSSLVASTAPEPTSAVAAPAQPSLIALSDLCQPQLQGHCNPLQ
jgi:hypothetical protein